MAIIGTALIKRLVATKAGVDVETTAKVLAAEAAIVLELIKTGSKVRILDGAGSMSIVRRKASRRKSPKTGEMVDIPERDVLSFKRTIPRK